MENNTMGFNKTEERENLKRNNIKVNSTLDIKKGDILRITTLNNNTLNDEFVYDETREYKVTGIRNSKKTGKSITILDIKWNSGCTFKLNTYSSKIEII